MKPLAFFLLLLLTTSCPAQRQSPLVQARRCLEDYRCAEGLAILEKSSLTGLPRAILEVQLLAGADRVGEAWKRLRELESKGDLSAYPVDFFLMRARLQADADHDELARKNYEQVLEMNPSMEQLIEARCGMCRTGLSDSAAATWLRDGIDEASQRHLALGSLLELLETQAEYSGRNGSPEAATLTEFAAVAVQEHSERLAGASASYLRAVEWQSQLGYWRGARQSLRRALQLAQRAGNSNRLAATVRRWCRQVVARHPSMEGQAELKKELLRLQVGLPQQVGRRPVQLDASARAVVEAQLGRLDGSSDHFRKALQLAPLPCQRMSIMGEWLQTLPQSNPERPRVIRDMLAAMPELAPEEPVLQEFSASRLWSQLAASQVEKDPKLASESFARAEKEARDPASRVQVLEAYLYFALQNSQLVTSRQVLARLLEASHKVMDMEQRARVIDGVLLIQLNYRGLWKRCVLVGKAMPQPESPGGILLHDLVQDRSLMVPLDLHYRARIEKLLARKDWREVSSAYLSQAYLYLAQSRLTEATLLLQHSDEFAQKADWAARRATLGLLVAAVALLENDKAAALKALDAAQKIPLTEREEEQRLWLATARAHVLTVSGHPEAALTSLLGTKSEWSAFERAKALTALDLPEEAVAAYAESERLFTDILSKVACKVEIARLRKGPQAVQQLREALRMTIEVHSLTVREIALELAALDPSPALIEEAARSLEQSVAEYPVEIRARMLEQEGSRQLLQLAGRPVPPTPIQKAASSPSSKNFLAEMNEIRARMPDLEAVLGAGVSDLLAAQERLKPGRVLLQYFCEPGRVHVVLATSEGFRTREVSLERDQLDSWIRDMAAQLERGKLSGRENLLYKLLIEPIEGELLGKQVQIIPNGLFWYLPWDSLKDGDGRYLCNRFELSLLPPSELLQNSPAPGATTHVVTVGGALESGLPAAGQEALQVAALFPNSRALVGPDATLAELRKATPGADILHIAAHSVVGSDLNRSYIQLSKGELPLESIYELRLPAGALVALSSCRSGLGERNPGREATSLASAFLAVGASTVVATLWQVDDATSLEFFRRYYGHLAKGASRAAALRETRQDCLKIPELASPSVWAAYTLQGDPGAASL